ncbi:MAG: hypothetical protein JWM53_3011 [bacterium]|nr:hypothetical protein [bacterium]
MMVAAACGPGSNAPPDGGPPLALDVIGNPQIGLHYGKPTVLRVRYHNDDPAAAAVAGATVHFSIFKDPAGSTLTADAATTDSTGTASVTLTAGQAEADFRVVATATNAAEADFDVVVSKLDFVEVDAQLTWPTASTLRALLYDDKTCAALPAAATLPAPSRALSKANATTATLQFLNLLSKPYALVGRAEDVTGVLRGYGCVDLGAELVPPGSVSVVPLPLAPAVPSATGSYTLSSTLTPAPSSYATLVGRWQQFGGGCPYGAAQALLDAMGIASHRDAALANGCRPATSPLDQQLQALLTAPPMAPANSLPAIASDLAAMTATAIVTSKLTVTAASASSYAAEHALATAEFAASPTVSKSYDLVAFGEPVIDDTNVPFSNDGATITIGAHGFTLGWTALWLQAFTDLSLTMRIAGLGSPPIPALVAAVVAPASRSGKMGCAAVDDLVCTVTTGSGTCALTTPCASALAPVAAMLQAPFAPVSGIDLMLAGSATPIDSNGDLVVDQLAGGKWTGAGLTSASTFTGDQP